MCRHTVFDGESGNAVGIGFVVREQRAHGKIRAEILGNRRHFIRFWQESKAGRIDIQLVPTRRMNALVYGAGQELLREHKNGGFIRFDAENVKSPFHQPFYAPSVGKNRSCEQLSYVVVGKPIAFSR